MVKSASRRLPSATLLVALLALAPASLAAVEDREQLAQTQWSAVPFVAGAVDLEMRFVQEDGPESGHVRVLLTPELRALTRLEARSAAHEAFLETLNEPGLGDQLRRITVVVRLMPAAHRGDGAGEEVVRFLWIGGRDWRVLPGR